MRKWVRLEAEEDSGVPLVHEKSRKRKQESGNSDKEELIQTPVVVDSPKEPVTVSIQVIPPSKETIQVSTQKVSSENSTQVYSNVEASEMLGGVNAEAEVQKEPLKDTPTNAEPNLIPTLASLSRQSSPPIHVHAPSSPPLQDPHASFLESSFLSKPETFLHPPSSSSPIPPEILEEYPDLDTSVNYLPSISLVETMPVMDTLNKDVGEDVFRTPEMTKQENNPSVLSFGEDDFDF